MHASWEYYDEQYHLQNKSKIYFVTVLIIICYKFGKRGAFYNNASENKRKKRFTAYKAGKKIIWIQNAENKGCKCFL